MKQPRFPVGTTFKPVGRKHAKVCTVTDIHTTTNLAGEFVKLRYVATHDFLGQTLSDTDVIETTIARGLIATPATV